MQGAPWPALPQRRVTVFWVNNRGSIVMEVLICAVPAEQIGLSETNHHLTA